MGKNWLEGEFGLAGNMVGQGILACCYLFLYNFCFSFCFRDFTSLSKENVFENNALVRWFSSPLRFLVISLQAVFLPVSFSCTP